MGIAQTLLNTGLRRIMKPIKKSLFNFEHTLQFRDKENGSIADACIAWERWHAHMYRRAYLAVAILCFGRCRKMAAEP